MRPRFSKIRDTRDGNHVAIVSYLRKHGFEVIETERPVDILIWNGTKAGWGEIKTTARNAMVKRGQLEFMACSRMPVAFIKTEDEAFEFAMHMDGLSDEQKNALACLLAVDSRKQFHPAMIERTLGLHPTTDTMTETPLVSE